MVYIRVKKFKRKNGKIVKYAYLVKSRWKKRVGKGSKQGARQKVKGFLGRVCKGTVVKDVNFFEHFKISDLDSYVKENSLRKIAEDLVGFEFVKHDVNDVYVNFDEQVVRRDGNKTVVQMNDGFLCDYTLNKLVGFRFKEDESEAGMALAKVFVDAGIKIPEELFVKVFEKVS